MEIETLDLRQEKENKDIISFDEGMILDGSWCEISDKSSDYDIVKRLEYRSSEWEYYLCQDYHDTEVYLKRCRK